MGLLAIPASLLPIAAQAADSGENLRVISAPDCTDATGIIPELAPAPFNATYLRVQHIGDPGSAELEGEVANVVTLDRRRRDRFLPAAFHHAQAQRGFRDLGPPNPASAFQLWCNGAGFFINSRQFSHATPLTLEGPSASVARDLDPPATVFRDWTSALTIDADVSVPWVQYDGHPTAEGTAQVSFFYYARDTTTGTTFAHVIALFDNRAPGVNGTAGEAVSADAYTAFVVSPLRPTVFGGAPVQYVTVGAGSAHMRFETAWPERIHFRAQVTYDNFRALLLRLKADSLPAISPRPEDYRITLFGVLGEIFPGTTTEHEVGLGASVIDLTLAESFGAAAPVPAVEYHNAALDHYFVSHRAADIEALDSGRFAGWQRTGETFAVYPAYMAGQHAVCRFYLPPARGDSHFFSASATECAEVAAAFPDFILEDPAVMFVGLPDVATGACASGTKPIHRFWNRRADTNHRYVSSESARGQMLAAGWIAEGYGPDGVAMCAAPSLLR